MSDFYINHIPQHIMYNGNLYVLEDTNVPTVDDVTMDGLKRKCDEMIEQLKDGGTNDD